MSGTSLVELREELAEKSRQLYNITQEAGDDWDLSKISSIGGDNTYKAAELQRRDAELKELGQKVDQLQAVAGLAELNKVRYERFNQPAAGLPMPGQPDGKGGSYDRRRFDPNRLREWIMEQKGYREFQSRPSGTVTFEIPETSLKTIVTLSTANNQPDRLGPVNMALEERTVIDMLGSAQTSNNTVEYYEETTFTNNAAPVAEQGTKPESATGFTLRTEPIRKMAHWIPMTKEAMDDVPFLESIVRSRLAFGLERVEEAQVLSGAGTGQNLTGLINRSGIQTQAMGAEDGIRAIYRAMQKVRGASGSGFAEPDGVVIHPNDWTDIKLSRSADGIYLWGNPSDEGPDRIWGKMVRQTTAITEGTALTGGFRQHAMVLRREGITITLSTEHSTYFVENKVAILAESRLGLAVFRPSAFATVTGI